MVMEVSAQPMGNKEFILESAINLKRWNETPRRVVDDYADYEQGRINQADSFFTRAS